MIWIVASVLTAFGMALFVGMNRHFNLNPVHLNFWRTGISAFILMPTLFFYDFPKEPVFYFAAVAAGVGSAALALANFSLSRRHNGRVAAMSMPMITFILFVLWLIIDPTQRSIFISNPLHSAMEVICLAVGAIALLLMRRNDATFTAFSIIIPVSIFVAVCNVIAKWGLNGYELMQVLVVLAFIIMVSQTLTCALLIASRPKLRSFYMGKRMVSGAFFAAIVGLWNCFGAWVAFMLSPNPAYVNAIMMLQSVIIIAYHKIFNIPDDGKLWPGLMLVASAIGLVLLTAG